MEQQWIVSVCCRTKYPLAWTVKLIFSMIFIVFLLTPVYFRENVNDLPTSLDTTPCQNQSYREFLKVAGSKEQGLTTWRGERSWCAHTAVGRWRYDKKGEEHQQLFHMCPPNNFAGWGIDLTWHDFRWKSPLRLESLTDNTESIY